MSRVFMFYQRNSRAWSQWQTWAERTHFSCCNCGLVHTMQLRVDRCHPRKKTVAVSMRVRVHKAKTAQRRQQLKRKRKGIYA